MSTVYDTVYNFPPAGATDGNTEACIAECQSRYPITCYLPGILACGCVKGCEAGEPPVTGLFGSGVEISDITGGITAYGERALEAIRETGTGVLESATGAVERVTIPLALIVVGGLVFYLLVLTARR